MILRHALPAVLAPVMLIVLPEAAAAVDAGSRVVVTDAWRPGAVERDGDWMRRVPLRQSDLSAAAVMLAAPPGNVPPAERIVVPPKPWQVGPELSDSYDVWGPLSGR